MSERFDKPEVEINRLRKINQALIARVEQMTNDAGDSFALFQENAMLRRKAAAERDRLSHAIEQSGETVVITDPDGNILYANPAFEITSGYRREEALGQNPRILKSECHSREFYQTLWETISTEKKTWAGELTNRRKDGTLYTEFATISPVLDENGDILNYVAVKRDITEQKQAEDQLLQSNRHLKLATENAQELARRADTANQAKSEFLSNMSHEIRTPMNGVIGMAQLLLDTQLDDRQRKYLNVLHESAQTLMKLLDNILDLARIESGKMEMHIKPFQVRDLLDHSIIPYVQEAKTKGLTFDCSISDQIPSTLLGDAGRIQQILNNIFDNAVKFTREGSIKCRIDVQPNETSAPVNVPHDDHHTIIRFEIEDTGIGIPESARAELFGKFYQVDASTTRNYGGTGLGLNICQQLVERMGGVIGMESTYGQGSLFWFSIPLEVASGGTSAA